MKARVSEYMQNRRSLHLRDYLEQFQIQEAKIHGFGRCKKSGVDLVRYRKLLLMSRSRKCLQVNGFGPVNSQPLVKWREEIESQFEYSPHQNRVDSQFRQTIEADIEAKARVPA